MTLFRRILRGVGWIAAGLIVAVFLVGYAARYLPPSAFWWTDLFAVFLPLVSVGIGGLGFVWIGQAIYRGVWGRGLLAVVLLTLVAARFGAQLVPRPSPPRSDDALRVMTFNIPPSYGDGEGGAGVAAVVRREAPHVLAVQESRVRTGTTPQSPPARIDSPLQPLFGDSLGYTVPRVGPPDVEIEQPVLGRIRLDSIRVHPLPPDGETRERSRYTRVRFEWRGRSAVLYNLHLHTVGTGRPWTMIEERSVDGWATFLRTYREGALRRAQQARLIRRRVERESMPVLIVGDLNSTPHQWAYGHLAAGRTNAVARKGQGWGATFPALRPVVQIDHVLAGPAWDVVAARVPDSVEEPSPSDHRPVVAHLRWADN